MANLNQFSFFSFKILSPVCDSLLTNNTKYCAISQNFQGMAEFWSNFR